MENERGGGLAGWLGGWKTSLKQSKIIRCPGLSPAPLVLAGNGTQGQWLKVGELTLLIIETPDHNLCQRRIYMDIWVGSLVLFLSEAQKFSEFGKSFGSKQKLFTTIFFKCTFISKLHLAVCVIICMHKFVGFTLVTIYNYLYLFVKLSQNSFPTIFILQNCIYIYIYLCIYIYTCGTNPVIDLNAFIPLTSCPLKSIFPVVS